MRCVKCHSPRIIKFIDGFGEDRVFCRTCQESMILKQAIIAQKSIPQFIQPIIHRRWGNEGDRKIGSFISTR